MAAPARAPTLVGVFGGATQKPKPRPAALAEAVSLRSFADLRVRYYWTPARSADLSPFLTSLEWSEAKDQVAREFVIGLDNWGGRLAKIVNGGVVVIDFKRGTAWKEWFRGTAVVDRRLRSADEQSKVLRVQDPMRTIGRSEGSFSFPAGRTASQSIERLVKQLGVPLGTVTPTKKKLAALTYQGTWYDAINVLLRKARQAGDPRMVPEIHGGKFYLVRYVEPVWSWNVGTVLSRAEAESDISDVFTVSSLSGSQSLTVSTTTGKGKKARADTKKTTRTTRARAEANAKALAAFGVIVVQEEVDENNAAPDAIRRRARQKVAEGAKPKETLDVTLPFEALTVRRLQPVVFAKREPVTQAFGRYFVSSLSGRIAGDGCSLSLSLTKEADFYEAPTSQLEFTAQANADSATGAVANPGDLQVKGKPATAEQAQNMTIAYRVGTSLGASQLALEAAFVAGTQESSFTNLTGGHSSSVGVLQLLDTWLGGSVATKGGRRDVELVFKMFYSRGFTGAGGAIALARAHPSWTPAQVATAVQGNAAGAGDYAPWISEAKANLAAMS